MINTILVLCIGNICRSPMAEALLKRSLPEKTIQSAGLSALVGHPADPIAIQLMQEEGLDITDHRAQQVNGYLISGADLILTMDTEQKHDVERRYPVSRGKVFRLGEFARFAQFDVADPYREGIDSFRRAHRLIVAGIEEVSMRLAEMN